MTADFVESKPIHKYAVKSGRDIVELQYKNGRALIDREGWARDAFQSLRRACPHVPEEELVRLFHNRSPSQLELIQGDAVFREYNATHPIGRRKVKPRRGAARPPPGPRPKAAPKAKAKPATRKPVKAAPRKMGKAKRRR